MFMAERTRRMRVDRFHAQKRQRLATLPRDKRCCAEKDVGRGFLEHPSTHGFVRDGPPRVYGSVPVRRRGGTLVPTTRVDAGPNERPSKWRERTPTQGFYHRSLFKCAAADGSGHP